MFKTNFSLAILLVGVISCSSFESPGDRDPASAGLAISMVGVVGPRGEVLTYDRKGEFIVVKACEKYTVLGDTPTEARKNCKGKSNKVPVNVFKQALRNSISIDYLFLLGPLTEEETLAYLNGTSSLGDLDRMEKELERINKFITHYGEKNANLVRRDELLAALKSKRKYFSAIKKIESQIENTFNLIIDQSSLTITKFDTDKDRFLYTVLKNFNPNEKFPCGNSGSIDERIKDCSYQAHSQKEGFVLVTRSQDFKEVHKELSTGLLWGDLTASHVSYFQAGNVCKTNYGAPGNIKGYSWRLPTISEFKEAEKNGARKALPNMGFNFWTASKNSLYVGTVPEYYSSNLHFGAHSVRCVGQF